MRTCIKCKVETCSDSEAICGRCRHELFGGDDVVALLYEIQSLIRYKNVKVYGNITKDASAILAKIDAYLKNDKKKENI